MQERPCERRAHAIRGAPGVGSRQHGLCTTPGACPCKLSLRLSKAEHPVEGLVCSLVWQRSHGFIVLEEFQTHRMVSAVEKCPAIHPGLCCVLVSWSGDPPGREGPSFTGLPSKHKGLALLSPLPVAELRSGCRAAAVGTSRHQVPGVQTSEGQLAYMSADN